MSLNRMFFFGVCFVPVVDVRVPFYEEVAMRIHGWVSIKNKLVVCKPLKKVSERR